MMDVLPHTLTAGRYSFRLRTWDQDPGAAHRSTACFTPDPYGEVGGGIITLGGDGDPGSCACNGWYPVGYDYMSYWGGVDAAA